MSSQQRNTGSDFKELLHYGVYIFSIRLSRNVSVATEVGALYHLALHCSLTLVSDSLAWDWVPVEAHRLLPSNQKHQEQDLGPAHGSHVSSHSPQPVWSDGSAVGSISRSGGLEGAAGLLAACLAERKKPRHQLKAAIHFLY